MHIKSLTTRKLLSIPHHPLTILSNQIESFFMKCEPSFHVYKNIDPIVSVKECFDDLIIPIDHVSRKPTDTYYLSQNTLLRTHTSAHQTSILKNAIDQFIVIGDVYRKDEIDAKHFPCFHQVEGVKVFPSSSKVESSDHLHYTIESLLKEVFGSNIKMRWVDAYFPFTLPSFEVELMFNDEWLEILGCGVIHDQVLRNSNRDPSVCSGWAFGLGLERWAMKLFGIKDIRQFWSTDRRFLDQFVTTGLSTMFKEYSASPACIKDVSFWLSDDYNENEFLNIVREIGKDLVERVECIDTFVNTKLHKTSKCYRIYYRHMERSLTNEEVNLIQSHLRNELTGRFKCSLR